MEYISTNDQTIFFSWLPFFCTGTKGLAQCFICRSLYSRDMQMLINYFMVSSAIVSWLEWAMLPLLYIATIIKCFGEDFYDMRFLKKVGGGVD